MHVRLLLVVAMAVGLRAGWLAPAAAVASMRAYAHCVAHGHGNAVPERCCHVRRDAADPAAKTAVAAPVVVYAEAALPALHAAILPAWSAGVRLPGPPRFLLLRKLRC